MASQARSRLGAPTLIFLGSLAVALTLSAEWPQFRGPAGQGHAAGALPPLRWGEDQNIAWKTSIPGLGWSSPVVSDGQIWLTTAENQGRSLEAIRVSTGTGQIVQRVEIFRSDPTQSIHDKNSHASPTPILEPDRVYVHFGTRGTAALDREGRILWKNQEHRIQHGHGAGGSPVVWENLLIFTCDGTDRQFVTAIDKNTGETAWTTSRGRTRMSFATPLVLPADGDRPPLVVAPGADYTAAYDPRTGEERWRVRYDGFSLVPRPVFAHGLVYFVSGFYRPRLFAVRPDGEGDVTSTHVEWSTARSTPLTPSPIVVGDELYMVNDNGIASCLDARTGELHWQQRLGGGFSASPVAAGDRIYFTSEQGETTVIRAGRQFERLAVNRVDGRTLASLAVVDGVIYLRSDAALYRIGEP